MKRCTMAFCFQNCSDLEKIILVISIILTFLNNCQGYLKVVLKFHRIENSTQFQVVFRWPQDGLQVASRWPLGDFILASEAFLHS